MSVSGDFYRNVYRPNFRQRANLDQPKPMADGIPLDEAFADGGWRLAAWDGSDRILDPDDYALIEHIREHGITCTSLGGWRIPLAEEQAYWERHWEIEPGVPRVIAPKPPPPLPEEIVARAAEREERRRENVRRRAKEAAETAEAAAELTKERAAWKGRQLAYEQERERRMLQTMLSDIEWQAAGKAIDAEAATEDASPEQIAKTREERKAGIKRELEFKRLDRMHILQRTPSYKKRAALEAQWRAEDEDAIKRCRNAVERAARRREAQDERKAEAAQLQRIEREALRKAEIERLQQANAATNADIARRETARRTEIAGREAERQAQLREEREMVRRAEIAAREDELREERALLADKQRAEIERQRFRQMEIDYEDKVAKGIYTKEAREAAYREIIKGRILCAIRGTGTKVWTVDLLVQATGATSEMVLSCAQELAGTGFIHGIVNYK